MRPGGVLPEVVGHVLQPAALVGDLAAGHLVHRWHRLISCGRRVGVPGPT